MYKEEDKADLKAYSVPIHVNPGFENCINKLIMQYFCTCVIPFVMLKHTVGGGRWNGLREPRYVVGQSRERWILQLISLSCCVNPSGCKGVCGRTHVPTSIFNVCIFVCSLGEWPGSLIYLYLSRGHHCFPCLCDTVVL